MPCAIPYWTIDSSAGPACHALVNVNNARVDRRATYLRGVTRCYFSSWRMLRLFTSWWLANIRVGKSGYDRAEFITQGLAGWRPGICIVREYKMISTFLSRTNDAILAVVCSTVSPTSKWFPDLAEVVPDWMRRTYYKCHPHLQHACEFPNLRRFLWPIQLKHTDERLLDMLAFTLIRTFKSRWWTASFPFFKCWRAQ